MSGKTPGQAAYEAAEAHSPYGAPPWDDVNDKLRAAWEAAAQAAIAATLPRRVPGATLREEAPT